MSRQPTNSPQDIPEPAPRMRRGLRVLLFVSLALNLAVAGLVGGAIVSHGFGGGERPPRLDQMGGPMTRALSPQDRREIGRALRDAYREARPSRADFRKEYDRVIAALRARPYDAASVRASIERQMTLMQERGSLGQEMLLQRLEAMTDAERGAFADRLQQALSEHRERDGKRWHGPRPDH